MPADTSNLLADFAKWASEPLDPELAAYVNEDPMLGKMLRHPLVYQVPLVMPGHANISLRTKKEAIAKALEDGDFSQVIWLHERPYRMAALMEHVLGEVPGPLTSYSPEVQDLVLDVWVDTENIREHLIDWADLFDVPEGTLLGTPEEHAAFEALPDPVPAWRGGTAGAWSWSPTRSVAETFAARSGHPVRHAMIPKKDVFGYLLRRGEDELLVRPSAEREHLVWPDGVPDEWLG